MPLLNDLLDFSDHPLMPPPSAQLFAEHLPHRVDTTLPDAFCSCDRSPPSFTGGHGYLDGGAMSQLPMLFAV